MDKDWKTIYQCKCKNLIKNGVGKCGRGKNDFLRLGVGYWKWKPKLMNIFYGVWIVEGRGEIGKDYIGS